MSDPFMASIILFAGNFAPRGWALCLGQQVSISQHSALFALLGTNYGGDGVTTFCLPDLRGRAAFGTGTGPGLQPFNLGQRAGAASHTLLLSEMPTHNHTAIFVSGAANLQADVTLNATSKAATLDVPAAGAQLADVSPNLTKVYADAGGTQVRLGGTSATVTGTIAGNVTINTSGGSQPFATMPPYLALNYIIALEGIFPPRN